LVVRNQTVQNFPIPLGAFPEAGGSRNQQAFSVSRTSWTVKISTKFIRNFSSYPRARADGAHLPRYRFRRPARRVISRPSTSPAVTDVSRFAVVTNTVAALFALIVRSLYANITKIYTHARGQFGF